jgi:hypothetical protein
MSTPAMLEAALLAQAVGLAVHYQRGKRAIEPRWSTSPPKIAEELRRDTVTATTSVFELVTGQSQTAGQSWC